MIAKFAAYFITQSNFILTDAAESIVNVLASSFAFYSIYLSAQPRDENHPYGHGKVEFFSVFVEGALIVIAGIIITIKSSYNIFYPQKVHQILTGTLIIGVSGLINGLIGYYIINKGKALRSVTLEADGKHLITDAITSIGLVVGLLLIYFTDFVLLDSVLSILMGMYIVYIGYKLARKSVAGLMDEADFKLVDEIISILDKYRKEEWIDIHNLRAQKYGNELHIDCHMTLPNYFELSRVHQEISLLDQIVNEKASVNTEFFIHTDPCLPQCCHYCSMQDCPIRSEPQRIKIPWILSNVTPNKKHFA